MENLLDLLTKEEMDLVKIKNFKKNTTIFHENDTCKNIGIIIEGEISIVSYSFSGKEVIYNSLTKGNVFGNNLLFSDAAIYRGNVITNRNSSIAFIDKKSLINILQNNEKFLIEYLKIQSNFGKVLNSKIKLLSFNNAQDRFKYFLFINNNEIIIKSITDLARTLSLERETLSRLISKLLKEGIITRNKHKITLLKP